MELTAIGVMGYLYIHSEAHINVQRRWRKVQRREWFASDWFPPDGMRDFRRDRWFERGERKGVAVEREVKVWESFFFFLSFVGLCLVAGDEKLRN